MPAPIDLLYRLTDRDQAFPHWGPTRGSLGHTEAAGLSMTSDLADWDAGNRAPAGTVLFITNLLAYGRPAATETVARITVSIRNRNTGLILTELLNATGPDVPAPEDLTVQSVMDIPILIEREFLVVAATFSAGPNSFMSLNWAGYIMPMGSIGFN